MILSRGREFFLLIIWSIVIWLFFEFLNLRIKNWYYINATSDPIFQIIGFTVSYGTVLPALFETFELLETTGLFSSSSLKRIKVTEKLLWIIFIAGVAGLLFPVFFPRYGFPFVWMSLIFLLEPVNYRLGGRSILRDLESGLPRRLYLLLLTGMICGFLWEFWNFWARTKWIYTVPFFEDFKLFEMPILGFFGFPPFTVECYVIMNFIGIFRSRRGWEEDKYRLSIQRKMPILLKGSLLFLLSGWCTLNFILIDHYTIKSYYPHLYEVGMDRTEEVVRLKRAGICSFDDLIAISRDMNKKVMALDRTGLSPSSLEDWIDCSYLVSLKGMGTRNYLLLRDAGIRRISDLMGQDPQSLFMRLKERYPRSFSGDKFPTEAMVRMWIKEARKYVNKRSDDDG